MTVASVATSQTKKLMKFSLSSLFRRGFNPSKCKTAAKMAVARIKLLRNKRQVVVKQMRRDVAMLLESGQDATARIRVEHVIREQNILAANEVIELFCELIVNRLTIITKQRECPTDLKEGISSLIFAAPRCSEIPELGNLRDIFEKKYGRDFVTAATDLRPTCGVNRMLVDKLSVRNPTGEFKLKIMKEIAKEFQVDWDTTETEQELLKPPEEVIDGPRAFISASSLPVRPPTREPVDSSTPVARSNSCIGVATHFQDTESAAEAAAESAKKALAAAQAAAILATRENKQLFEPSSFNNTTGIKNSRFMDHHKQSRPSQDSETSSYYGKASSQQRGVYRRHSYNNDPPPTNPGIKFDESDYEEETETEEGKKTRNVFRRHSYNAPSSTRVDIKFDESDYEDETETESEEGPPARVSSLPPDRPPPQVPASEARRDSGGHHVHPKLPDYDALAARFEALRHSRSRG